MLLIVSVHDGERVEAGLAGRVLYRSRAVVVVAEINIDEITVSSSVNRLIRSLNSCRDLVRAGDLYVQAADSGFLTRLSIRFKLQ